LDEKGTSSDWNLNGSMKHLYIAGTMGFLLINDI